MRQRKIIRLSISVSTRKRIERFCETRALPMSRMPEFSLTAYEREGRPYYERPEGLKAMYTFTASPKLVALMEKRKSEGMNLSHMFEVAMSWYMDMTERRD